MSNSYLFQYKNGFSILVFGTSKQDARDEANSFAPAWGKVKFIAENPSVENHVLCKTTAKQSAINRKKNSDADKEYYKEHPEEKKRLIEAWAAIGFEYDLGE